MEKFDFVLVEENDELWEREQDVTRYMFRNKNGQYLYKLCGSYRDGYWDLWQTLYKPKAETMLRLLKEHGGVFKKNDEYKWIRKG